jgi:adenine-specific DNA methylase
MNITGSWATDTEMTGALKTDKSFLSSSVTVSCRPSQRKGIGSNREVVKAIEKTVAKEVDELYSLGFRGADLLTACFGQAVSEFGRYEKVEKADGSEVTVAELLELARESAFNALLTGFQGDDFTKFYIGWMQLNVADNFDRL